MASEAECRPKAGEECSQHGGARAAHGSQCEPLPAPNRAQILTLRRRREVNALFARGTRFRGRLLTIVVASTSEPRPRCLFVVGRKVGKAVVRNRVRRRLRECYRLLLPRVAADSQVAFVARPDAATATWTQLAREMSALLERAGVLEHNGCG